MARSRSFRECEKLLLKTGETIETDILTQRKGHSTLYRILQNQQDFISMVSTFEAILIIKTHHFYKIMLFLLILLPFCSVFQALLNGF